MQAALVVSAALAVFLLSLGAGTRWPYWWAITAALYLIAITAG